MDVTIAERWHALFPGARVGILRTSGVANTKRATPLDDRKRELEVRLRDVYAGLTRPELLEPPVLKT